MLNKQLKTKFDQEGFLVLKSFFSKEEVEFVLEAIQSAPKSSQKAPLTKGAMTFYRNVFSKSQDLQKFIGQQKIIDVLTQITDSDLWVRWDQAVAKGPGADTFPWHQDNGYNSLRDEHYQFWIALTPMTAENGGLCLQPGSHKTLLPHKQVGNEKVYDGVLESPISIEAEAGDVVIFSSFLLHSTTPNVTQNTRWAYVIEYMKINCYDPYVQPPYFVVSKNGKSNPAFVESYPGSISFSNRLKYFMLGGAFRRLLPDWVRNSKKLFSKAR